MEKIEKSGKTVLSSKACVQFIGVDVSMSDFTVSELLEDGKYILSTYKNTAVGIESFIEKINSPLDTLVTLEATGTYSMKLVFALAEYDIPTAVLNPKQSKGFISGVLLSTTKTDNKDACALALYGKVNRPTIYVLPDSKVLEIKEFRSLLSMYKKQRTVVSNKLHALSFHACPSAFVVAELEADKSYLEAKIQKIETQLCDLSAESFDDLYELAISIKGIGKATATALLMATNGCTNFDNVKQLAKFLGVCPTQNESGKSVRGRRGLAKTGAKEVRALLYMCARSARRFNLVCKDLYERLRSRGKCHQVAMNAVSHKLVKQFFAVVTKRVPFDNEYNLKNNN